MKKELLKAIKVFGGNVIYDGWDDKSAGFMNVDIDIYHDRAGKELEDWKRFRVSLHQKDSYEENIEKLRKQREEIGEFLYKRELKILLP